MNHLIIYGNEITVRKQEKIHRGENPEQAKWMPIFLQQLGVVERSACENMMSGLSRACNSTQKQIDMMPFLL